MALRLGVLARRHLAAVVEKTREAQLRDDVDQARAADPLRLDVAPDHLELDAAVRQRDALDRALDRAHPVEDLAALEGRTGRRGRRDRPLGVAAGDLAVRAHVHQQARLRVAHEPCRHDVRDDVGARRTRRSTGRARPTRADGCRTRSGRRGGPGARGTSRRRGRARSTRGSPRREATSSSRSRRRRPRRSPPAARRPPPARGAAARSRSPRPRPGAGRSPHGRASPWPSARSRRRRTTPDG